MRTIAVLNQKGGVGKTTTVVNVASALAMKKQKVLVIDLDPQGHLTISMGVDTEAERNGAYEVLTKSAKIKDVVTAVRENVWLLGADIDLVGAESELVPVVGRETILREAIRQVEDEYDYIIIDCPPSLGLLTLNALAAVKEVVIPIQPHFLALQGFGKLLQTVSLVSRRINPELKITGILLCMFNTRITLSSEVKADIEKFLASARGSDSPWADAHILPVYVRTNIKLAEAPSYGKTIFEYEPSCNGAVDYENVAEYIHTQMTGRGEICDEAVSEGKICDEAVSEVEICDEAVSEVEIVDEAVSVGEICDEAVSEVAEENIEIEAATEVEIVLDEQDIPPERAPIAIVEIEDTNKAKEDIDSIVLASIPSSQTDQLVSLKKSEVRSQNSEFTE